jgi:hypothetical protein
VISKTMTVLAMALAFLALPASAADADQQAQKKPAGAKTAKMDTLGGGKACKDGKCGSKGQGKAGMGCCCAGMQEKRGCKMGSGGMEGMHGMHGDDMAAEDMMERIRKLEERVEAMQKSLAQQSGA